MLETHFVCVFLRTNPKSGVGNPTFTNYFEVLDLHLGCLVLETHFPRKCSKNIDFYTVWEPAWYTEADQHNQADQADQAEMVHDRQLGP